jgi:XTP/dITP diphosphohydrolase
VPLPELERLISVMARLRQECPWDAQQTHRSLVQYLIEETAETIEAIEVANQDHLQEELGDLLLQVIFHAQIASEQAGGFTVEEVARGIADKLISRHPYVFASAEVPVDQHYTWEQRKATEKGRTSALQGIPEQLSALARVNKIISRARSHRLEIALPDDPTTAEEVVPRCWRSPPALKQPESILSRRFAMRSGVWRPGSRLPSRHITTQLRLSSRRLFCAHVRASAATAGPAGASAAGVSAAELSSAELSSAELSSSELSAPELSAPEPPEPAKPAVPLESRSALSGATALPAAA